jgi:putative aminopeptidase FrvX
MADFLEKVVYLTDAQYNTLAGGGTVGTLTGINNNYIYLTDSMVTLNDLDASIR